MAEGRARAEKAADGAKEASKQAVRGGRIRRQRMYRGRLWDLAACGLADQGGGIGRSRRGRASTRTTLSARSRRTYDLSVLKSSATSGSSFLGSGLLTPAALAAPSADGSTESARCIRTGVVVVVDAGGGARRGLDDSSWPGGNGGVDRASPRVESRNASSSDSAGGGWPAVDEVPADADAAAGEPADDEADRGRTTSAK